MAKLMNKYLRMDLGKAMALSGMCVALSSALVYDKKDRGAQCAGYISQWTGAGSFHFWR